MRWVPLVALGFVVASACTGLRDRGAGPGTTTTVPPFTYVAVGASETVGVGADDPVTEAWPTVFHRTALPQATTYVNVGISGATVRQALTEELPRAVAERPRLVTVWLNVNDLVGLIPAADYERDLAALVRSLRQGGAAEVLVANTPPVEQLPVVRACLPNPPPGFACPLPVRVPSTAIVTARVAEYNQAIARVAEQEGAIVVDLHDAAGDDLDASFVSADGFHPSTAGHRRVAEAFAEALRSSDRTRMLAAPESGAAG